MIFKVGQKVVCESPIGILVKGEIYTCMGANSHLPDQMQVLELGIGDDGFNYWSAYYSRFRPIDYTFGEKLAEEIQEEINQENLIGC